MAQILDLDTLSCVGRGVKVEQNRNSRYELHVEEHSKTTLSTFPKGAPILWRFARVISLVTLVMLVTFLGRLKNAGIHQGICWGC